MAAIALVLTLLALVAAYYGVQAVGAQAKAAAMTCFAIGGILFIAAIAVTIAGHALSI